MRLTIVTMLFIFGIFAAESRAQGDNCAESFIKEQTRKAVESLSRTDQGRNALAVIDQKIEEGSIPANKREDVIHANMELSIRMSLGCEVPDALKQRLMQAHSLETGEGEQCPVGKFKSEAQKRVSEAQENNQDYETFELQAYEKLLSEIPPEAHGRFKSVWDSDAAFREQTVTAIYQTGLREQNGCANPILPMTGVMEKLVKAMNSQ